MGKFETWRDYDWQGMAEALRARGKRFRDYDLCYLYGVFDPIKHLPFPSGYLEDLRKEMVAVLRENAEPGQNADTTSVYLTFFGTERASHMKIGVAASVRDRINAIRTGNPLPSLWTYSAQFQSRQMAIRVERALIRHMRTDRAEGEWVNVHGLSEEAAEVIVGSLAEVASVVAHRSLQFTRARV